jgi:3'-phosphoadenosine 5'-phosphosulfate sulfotransferase (PAPS reductase)/FAD synthetase
VIDLTKYDWIVANSSAGKDSQAMLHWLIINCRDQEVPLNRMVVAHADLKTMEWKGTRELAEEHAKHYGVRFEAVTRQQGDLLTQVRGRGMWPSSTCRYCTSDHKRAQIRRIFTQLTAEVGGNKYRPTRILNCMGLRADESPARRKKKPFELDENASNGKRLVYNWLPLHSWTEEDVWSIIKEAGTRPHPAYKLGMPRLSCCFCIFAPKPALMIAGRHNPELLDEYIQVETEISHRFRVDLSLAEVKKAILAGETAGPVTAAWNM